MDLEMDVEDVEVMLEEDQGGDVIYKLFSTARLLSGD